MDAGSDVSDGIKASFPGVVFIDGLVNGQAIDTANGPLDLSDVRVCIASATSNQVLTTYAVPDDVPIPLTNYPGIHRGGGVDLGSLVTDETSFVFHVFRAADLQTDAAWVASRSLAFSCKSMVGCAGSTCIQHKALNVSLTSEVNVVALVDQVVDGSSDVMFQQSGFEGTGYAGAPGSLYGGVANFSGWHADNAFFTTQNGSGTHTVMAEPLPDDTASPPLPIASQVSSYDMLGVQLNEINPADTFWQSLDSIAFVTNQAVDPPTFYGVRKNFVFALIGNPLDPTSVAKNGGRDPSFDGTGLHVVAVAYGAPVAKP